MFAKWVYYYPARSDVRDGVNLTIPKYYQTLRRRVYKGIPEGARQGAWGRLLYSNELV